jgi:hypothetical protein
MRAIACGSRRLTDEFSGGRPDAGPAFLILSSNSQFARWVMNDTSNIVPFAKRRKTLTAKAALIFLAKVSAQHPDGVLEVDSISHLGRLLGWERSRTSKQMKAWEEDGKVTVDRDTAGKLLIRILPSRDELERAGMPSQDARTRRTARMRTKRANGTRAKRPANTDDGSTGHDNHLNSIGTQTMAKSASAVAPPDTPSGTSAATSQNTPMPNNPVIPHAERISWRLLEHDRAPPMDFMDVLLMLVAISLAGVAAVLSISGMRILFDGTPVIALCLGVALECAKLIATGWLGMKWHHLGWGHRLPLIGMVFGVACLNAVSVYSQLVASHLAVAGAEQVAYERTDAEAGGRLDLAQSRVTDLDRRIAQIDATVEGAAQKGRSKAAIDAMRSQQQRRTQLVADRDRAQRDLADLKTSRSAGSAQHQAAVNEALPIQYVAEFLGIHRGGEEIIRWVIAGVVAVTDPFALLLASALGARRRRQPA